MCKIVYLYFEVYVLIFYGIINIIGSPNISNTWYVVKDIVLTTDCGYFNKWIATIFSGVWGSQWTTPSFYFLPSVLTVTNDSIVFQVFFNTSQNNIIHKSTRHWSETSVTGLWFPGFSFLFLKIEITLSSFQSAQTSCSSAARLLKNHWKRFCGYIIQCFEDPWMNTIRSHRFLGIQLWNTEEKNVLNTSALSMSLLLRWPSSSYNGLNVILHCL